MPMFRTFLYSTCTLLGFGAGVALTIHCQATSAVADHCYVMGYRYCKAIDGALRPETSDPRQRQQLTLFVKQLSREKLK